MGVDVRVVPTTREASGLAMSSRNVYLSPVEREEVAPKIYGALCVAKESLRKRGMTVEEIRQTITEVRGLLLFVIHFFLHLLLVFIH